MSFWAVLGWAAYLACSWTWCIGMFLPVLLVRDFGIWGFVVFAVPNVVGAGAMGWVLRRRGASERIVTHHRAACAMFSIVTISFQLCFMFWVVSTFFPVQQKTVQMPWLGLVLFAIGVLVATTATAGRPRSVLATLGSWLFSIGLAVWFIARGDYQIGLPNLPALGAERVIWLAPVCAFGFALCPYLDRTFLRARTLATGSTGIAAFALGFGVLFLCMILFTLGYAHVFGGTPVLPALKAASIGAALIVLAHIVSQGMFTVIAHFGAWEDELRRRTRERPFVSLRGMMICVPIVLGVVILPYLFLVINNLGISHAGLSGFEILYRVFMSFYGLVFPAYVWLCMIPARGEKGTQRPTRGKLAVLGIACLLAAPCYWMGFIERETVWLAPGLGVVLLARLLLRGPTQAPSPATGGGGQP